jgi:hypothetical protein
MEIKPTKMLRQTVLVSISRSLPKCADIDEENNPPDSVVQSAIARVE